MDWSRFFTVLIGAFVVFAVLALLVVGYLMWRYRIPPKGLLAMGAALVYLVSPVDVIPEAVLGPLGLIDDTGAVAAAAFFVYRLVVARRMLADAGVDLKRRRGRRASPGTEVTGGRR